MISKKPIKSFAIVGAGQGAPQKEGDFSEDGHPFIRAGHLEELLESKNELVLPKVNEKIAKKYRLKLYGPGTIVFAKSGMSATKGRIYKLQNTCYVVNHLATLETLESAYPDFIVYALRKYSPVKLINDASYPSINQTAIERHKIPFPSFPDQVRIAKLLSKVETLVSQRKESLRLLDELLKSTFNKRFIETNYPLKKLGDLSVKITDGEHKKPDYKESGFPFISVVNITKGFLSFENCKFVSEEDHSKFNKRCNPQIDDILYSKVGATYGRAAIVDIDRPFSLYVSVALIKPDRTKINSNFLKFALNHPFLKRQADKSIKGAGVPDLHLIEIKSFKVPFPPRKDQDDFAKFAERVEALKVYYQASLNELENLYGSLSQRAFKGELDLSRIVIDHIVPRSIGGTDQIDNLTITTREEHIKIADKKGSILKIITSAHFKDREFSFEELWQKWAEMIDDDSLKYDDVKEMVFKALRGELDVKLTQSFNTENRRILLRVPI